MPISFAEQFALTCPRCREPFTTDLYVIVDGVERPDLVGQILDDTLHGTNCPRCGQAGRVPAPLLYHDGRNGRVLLGVPPGMPEQGWRDIGQNLLWTLVGALPESARLPYLGDVQAENGLAGVAQVIRSERLAGSPEEDEDVPPIALAIQALLNAQGPLALERVFDQHAILREPQAITIMQELAAEAIKQGQFEAAQGFARAAELLQQVKQLRTKTAAHQATTADEFADEQIEVLAFALLRSTTGQQLAQAVDEHPELLESRTDAPLAEYAARARREGKLRIADGLDERLRALREIRTQYQQQQPVLDAVQAYLQAYSNDEIEAIVLHNDILTTDAADHALQRLAESARTDGDETLAQFVEQRRTFLRQVRAALGE